MDMLARLDLGGGNPDRVAVLYNGFTLAKVLQRYLVTGRNISDCYSLLGLLSIDQCAQCNPDIVETVNFEQERQWPHCSSMILAAYNCR
jgi:hypothetical protein